MVDPILKNQYISLNDILNMGFNAIITNSYILKKHIKTVVDVHKHLNFNGIIMTDSGAYQILRYGDIEVGNREIVLYQCEIKSDIGVILDIPTSYNVDRETALKSADETYKRAVEALDIVESCRDTLWTLPIQGGTYLDVLRQYAMKSIDVFYRGYSLYALGSPTTLLEQYEFDKIIDMIFTVRSAIPFSAPLHLFGAGHPLIIPFAIALGIDTMDSASYILYAKDDRYITSRGTYRLEDLRYLPCTCPICSKYSLEELQKASKDERTKLLALHNLYIILREFKEVKQAIKECRLWEYLESKASSHPATRRAFEQIKRYVEFIYRHTPIVKPKAKAVFIISKDSIYNPKVMIPRRRIIERFSIEEECLNLIPYIYSGRKIPFISNEIELSKCINYVYIPILGIAPLQLVDHYPYSQFEFGLEIDGDVINDLSYIIIEKLLIGKKMGKLAKVKIFICQDIEWQRKLYNKLADLTTLFKEINIDVVLKTVKC